MTYRPITTDQQRAFNRVVANVKRKHPLASFERQTEIANFILGK